MITARQLAEMIDEEFYLENHYYWSKTEPTAFAEEVAIRFAKMIAQAALKAASKGVNLPYQERTKFILNAYPIENIK